MDNKLLIVGAGLVALYYFTQGGAGNTPNGVPPSPQHRWVPGAGYVHESQLPQMGYVLWNGQWYHQTQFQVPNTGTYAGTNPQSPQWLSILNGLIATGGNIAQFFIDNSGSFGGGGGNDQGGQGGQGIQGITNSRDLFSRSRCNNGKYSTSTGGGTCSYNLGVK